MADEYRGDDSPPKSSADLIREAREALSRTEAAGSEASQDLMESARDWLGSNDPSQDTVSPDETATPPSEFEARHEIEVIFESPSSQPRPRRSRPPSASFPPGPVSTGRPGGPRRTILTFAIAAAVGLVAVVGVIAGLVAPVDSDRVINTSVESEGSISSASDPCTGATIAGDLDATITYYRDSGTSRIDIFITGARLEGSDGSIYTLQIVGGSSGTPDQETFVFDSELMVMTGDDDVEFLDTATFTVTIVDDEPDNWSYTSAGAACES